jgi:hypothetical protein
MNRSFLLVIVMISLITGMVKAQNDYYSEELIPVVTFGPSRGTISTVLNKTG